MDFYTSRDSTPKKLKKITCKKSFLQVRKKHGTWCIKTEHPICMVPAAAAGAGRIIKGKFLDQ
jgi:hypothetical protein